MKTVVTLQGPAGPHLPGAEPAILTVSVRNTGDLVMAYTLEALGALAGHARVEPATLNLYPGTEGSATVTVMVPRGAEVGSGDFPIAVKVTPTEFPAESVTQESTVTVLPYQETTAELIPRTSRGRRGAVHDLAIDNRGNTTINALVKGQDGSNALSFEARPQALEIPPGEAKFASVAVKPQQGFWRGPNRTHPFQVVVTPEEGEPVTLDATHLQEPRVPKWFWKALAALLALLLLLAALWFLLFKPIIASAAKDAVAPEVAKAQDAATDAGKAAESAGGAAGAADQAASSAEDSAKDAADSAGNPAPKVTTNPRTERLNLTTAKGATGTSDPFSVGSGAKMQITDVVFENQQGDFGVLTLQVNGDPVLQLALENFRSLDYHWVTPIVVDEDSNVTMSVQCRQPGTLAGETDPQSRCLQSVYLGGKYTVPR